MYWRFALILLFAPFITVLVCLPFIGEGAFIVLAGYPIFLFASLLTVPFIHAYIRKDAPSMLGQVFVCTMLGLSVGGLIACAIFWKNFQQYPDSGSIVETILLYGGLGAAHLLVNLTLYTHGPLRIADRSPM
jgi:hypothetical protein